MLESVQKWILEQGYPLEMRAAKAFRDGGFDVQQSVVYVDDGSAKSREIDLVVISPDRLGLTRVLFTAECKSSKKPWVLFSSQDSGAGMSVFWTYSLMSESARKLLANISQNDSKNGVDPIDIALFDRLKWMRKIGSIGYSLRQAFSDVDNAYSALVSTMKAAAHLNRREEHKVIPQFQFVFPLIVIDTPLLRCCLDATGKIQLEQINFGEILFTVPNRERETTCVKIVTIDHLPDFVTEARREVAQIRAEFRPEEEIIWKQLFGSERPLP